MAVEFFGFKISRKNDEDLAKNQSFVHPTDQDAAIKIDSALNSGGTFTYGVNFGFGYNNEKELIEKYRKMSLHSEIETSIDEIVNEAMSFEDQGSPVEIVLDEVEYSDKFKDKIQDEFENILRLLDFNAYGDKIFREWYVDGRLFYHVIVDENKTKNGIQELRQIDPRFIKKVREYKTEPNDKGVEIITGIDEYFLYDNPRFDVVGHQSPQKEMIKIPKESITYCNSGIIDEDSQGNSVILSFLDSAVKPWNQLSLIEDSIVIYRLSRAPERRIFYVDVGTLPKTNAEAYMNAIISKYKNKMVYDSQSGNVKDASHQMSMLEDIWLPRREGSKGTEVETLPGGQNLGDIEDLDYFRRKLYKALHIPLSRLEQESQFNAGRQAEISRDEVKFAKFIGKLRKRFAFMFMDLLKTQLILKNIVTLEDWKELREKITFRFNQDLHFEKLKDTELLSGQLEQLGEIDNYVGKYFSLQFVQKRILNQTELEIAEEKKQMEKEKKAGEIADLDPNDVAMAQLGMGGEEGEPEEEEEEPEPEEKEKPEKKDEE